MHSLFYACFNHCGKTWLAGSGFLRTCIHRLFSLHFWLCLVLIHLSKQMPIPKSVRFVGTCRTKWNHSGRERGKKNTRERRLMRSLGLYSFDNINKIKNFSNAQKRTQILIFGTYRHRKARAKDPVRNVTSFPERTTLGSLPLITPVSEQPYGKESYHYGESNCSYQPAERTLWFNICYLPSSRNSHLHTGSLKCWIHFPTPIVRPAWSHYWLSQDPAPAHLTFTFGPWSFPWSRWANFV